MFIFQIFLDIFSKILANIIVRIKTGNNGIDIITIGNNIMIEYKTIMTTNIITKT
jgi:hypothetical protein